MNERLAVILRVSSSDGYICELQAKKLGPPKEEP